MKRAKEPKQLRRGKHFHRLIQKEWLFEANDGNPQPERYIKKVNGKTGRVDILVDELGENLVSVIEIKASDWDNMVETNIVRNVKRQIRQIWSYVNSQLDIYFKEVCPGIIFPKLPKDPSRLELIESMFNSEGIQIIWHNESLEQLRIRNIKSSFQANCE